MSQDCATVKEVGEFFFTEAVAEHLIGVDFDPDGLCRRLQVAEDDAALKQYRRKGPRGVEESPLH